MPNWKSQQTIMRRNELFLVILLSFLHSNRFVVDVDALLPIDVGVGNRAISNKPCRHTPIDLLSLRFTDSSFPQTTMFFTSSSRSQSSQLSSSSSSSSMDKTPTESLANENTKRKKRSMYSFSEARKIARGHGFGSKEEFIEYDCPGAYQLPKNANEVWSEDWTSWEDFLGVPLAFEEAREVARARVGPSSVTKWKVSTEEEYKDLFGRKEIDDGDIASRLPYRPDLKYKTKGWVSWEDFLQHDKE